MKQVVPVRSSVTRQASRIVRHLLPVTGHRLQVTGHWSRFAVLMILLLLPVIAINQNKMETIKRDRQPAVAGSFYPSDPTQLREMVKGFFDKAKPDETEGLVRAIVVPHAGYVFSGGVAASGYNQLDPDYPYKRVFVIASSHRVSIGKASVYTIGDYITPLGKLEVDQEISAKLAANGDYFTDDPLAHIQEHSVEVQLPFLQMKLKNKFKIVPIVLGTQTPSVCRGIAGVLKTYFVPENLFVISADFSHYPAYEDAMKVDAATAAAFCSNSTEKFLSVLKANEKLSIPDLATSMCAWPAGYTLLNITEGDKSLQFKKTDYKNSGDIQPYGDKSSVVGYNAITISQPDGRQFQLTDTDKKELLRIARSTVDSYVRTRQIPPLQQEKYSRTLQEKAGAFVTLKIDGKLRGCIGSFEPDDPLYKVVQRMAIASSTQDSRFTPVEVPELPDIVIEISVLTPLKKIKDIKEIQLGKHGIYIRQGYMGGTFLPQVATETGWTLEEFLGHCARDKAGIGWDGWKNADIYIYEAIIFEEGSH